MRLLFRLFAPLLAVGVLAGCNNPAPQQPPGANRSAVAQQAPAHSWPPPAPASSVIAQNLLADNWVVVFDGSGSMDSIACGTGSRPRIETAQKAVIQFSRSLPPNVHRGLVEFPSPKVSVPLAANNHVAFETQVGKIKASGGTPLRSSMEVGASVLTAQAQAQRGYGTYHMLVVTDGEASSGEDPAEFTRKLVTSTPIQVHVIGFCVDGKHSLDIQGYTQYVAANNPAALERSLKAVLAESEAYADARFMQ